VIIETTRGVIAAAAKPPDAYGPYYGLSTDSLSGQTVTPEGALSLSAVYGAVSMVANTCGTMPLEVIDTTAESGRKVVQGGQLAPLLRYAPNADMSGVDLWTFVFACLLMRGNAYLAKIKDASGRVVELYPMLPGDVTPWRGPNGQKLFRVRVYRGTTALEGDFDENAILHIKGPSLTDPLVGASPIEMVRNAIGTQLAQTEYQARAYKDGMLIKGVLSTPEKHLNPDAVTRVKSDWRSTYGGVGNSHDIAVLHAGITFQQVALSPEDAQFIQTMKWGHTQIATIFQIPASRMNGDAGSSLTYANQGQDDLYYVKQACMPRVAMVEASINRDKDLFGASSAWVPKFNMRAALRADEKTRFEIYRTARDIGAISANEIRAAEDQPSIGPVGDDFAPLKSSNGASSAPVDGSGSGSANA